MDLPWSHTNGTVKEQSTLQDSSHSSNELKIFLQHSNDSRFRLQHVPLGQKSFISVPITDWRKLPMALCFSIAVRQYLQVYVVLHERCTM